MQREAHKTLHPASMLKQSSPSARESAAAHKCRKSLIGWPALTWTDFQARLACRQGSIFRQGTLLQGSTKCPQQAAMCSCLLSMSMGLGLTNARVQQREDLKVLQLNTQTSRLLRIVASQAVPCKRNASMTAASQGSCAEQSQRASAHTKRVGGLTTCAPMRSVSAGSSTVRAS